jgi:hypothetical protein
LKLGVLPEPLRIKGKDESKNVWQGITGMD